jgi:hypothetical protein
MISQHSKSLRHVKYTKRDNYVNNFFQIAFYYLKSIFPLKFENHAKYTTRDKLLSLSVIKSYDFCQIVENPLYIIFFFPR